MVSVWCGCVVSHNTTEVEIWIFDNYSMVLSMGDWVLFRTSVARECPYVILLSFVRWHESAIRWPTSVNLPPNQLAPQPHHNHTTLTPQLYTTTTTQHIRIVCGQLQLWCSCGVVVVWLWCGCGVGVVWLWCQLVWGKVDTCGPP